MFTSLIYAYEQYLLLMAASVGSYQANKAAALYPAGYETSLDPVESTQYSAAPQLNIKFPRLQDSAVFTLLLSTLLSKASYVPNTTSTEVIDQTDDSEIEPDTLEAIKQLEQEIDNITLYQLNYYQEDLDKLQRGQKTKTNYNQDELQYFIDLYDKEIKSLTYEINITKLHSQRQLTPEEKKGITETAAERMVKIKAEQRDKTKNCDCSIIPFITKKAFRRNMSDLSADYQGTLSGESWQRTINPKSGKMSVEIKEWLYLGPAGKADFDGWLERFCLLLEMKANYDSLMFSRTIIDVKTGLPKLKKLGEDKIIAFRKQAETHNQICSAHAPTARCCWIFMTQYAYNEFIREMDDLPAITAIYVPLDKALL